VTPIGRAALACLSVLAVASHAVAEPPAFTETTCSLPDVSPAIAPLLRCGTVAVPRDDARPAAGRFNLAVVVVGSAQQPALPDPVVYISGGPGGPLTIYADYQARHPYATKRDLILVDQRGMGRSEPSLCPDLDGKMLGADVNLAAAPGAAAQARRDALYAACRREATASGIDLRDFGTRVTVADFEQVRQALGITRWNVVGESYGTTVAMTLAALHPDRVRSLTLDSLYPPDPLPLRSTIAAGARDAFFAACERDAACAGAYPHLAALYAGALQRLDRNPLMVAAPSLLARSDGRMRLSASLFAVLVDNLLYYPGAYPGLPRLIAAAHAGDGDPIAASLAVEVASFTPLNLAATAAVECRDRPHLRDALPASAKALDRMQLNGVCGAWSTLGPAPLIPTDTRIPTLILTGQFDPVAGPSLSRHVAGLIGRNARLIEFPLIGHNVRHFSPCAAAIVAEFIAAPTSPLDTSCTHHAAPIRFLPAFAAPRAAAP
jgi:pimeloyl-ACP methyl ester carboxylesterase